MKIELQLLKKMNFTVDFTDSINISLKPEE